jgi:hypothetical protein
MSSTAPEAPAIDITKASSEQVEDLLTRAGIHRDWWGDVYASLARAHKAGSTVITARWLRSLTRGSYFTKPDNRAGADHTSLDQVLEDCEHLDQEPFSKIVN